MKPKDALVKDGTVPTKLGKGRLSGAQIARCKELAGMGWQIDGYTVSKSTTPDTAPVVTKADKVDPNRVVDVPDPTRLESEWQAYRHEDGKQIDVGMRTRCTRCRASFTYCRCESPQVWVDHITKAMVNFKPRTKPLTHPRW